MLRPSSVAFSDSFPPRGSLKKGIDLHFKLFATIRYETGDARPGGKPGKNWATHNMLRPSSVAFSDSFPPEKIGLLIICYAPHQSLSATASPQGEARKTVCNNPLRNGRCPPPGGKPLSKAYCIAEVRRARTIFSPNICMIVYRSGVFALPVTATRRISATSATLPL